MRYQFLKCCGWSWKPLLVWNLQCSKGRQPSFFLHPHNTCERGVVVIHPSSRPPLHQFCIVYVSLCIGALNTRSIVDVWPDHSLVSQAFVFVFCFFSNNSFKKTKIRVFSAIFVILDIWVLNERSDEKSKRRYEAFWTESKICPRRRYFMTCLF